MLDSSKHPRARCLDGSMAGYYIRKGTENRYLLFFEGGGWCYDQDCLNPTREGTIQDCHQRAHGRLGSSRGWPSAMKESDLTGMLSMDPISNPAFHNWTMVYLPYCDGTSWTGDAQVGDLHFRGKVILEAIIIELVSFARFRQAAQVVVSGGSAGASAVYYHADKMAKQFRLGGLSGEVLALPDAGFFLNLPDIHGRSCWPAQMRSLFDVAAAYDSLDAGCLDRFPNERWKCMFPEYYIDVFSVRTLAINSLYDSSELECTLRLECCIGQTRCHRSSRCMGKSVELFKSLRREHMRAWAPLLNRTGNGLWAPACVGHTLSWGQWTDPSWEVPAGSGNTQAAVVQRWLAKDDSDGRGFDYQDEVAWPNNSPCSAVPTTFETWM